MEIPASLKNDSTAMNDELLRFFYNLCLFIILYYDQSGFEIQPLSPLFLREDLGEFFKFKNLKTTFTLL